MKVYDLFKNKLLGVLLCLVISAVSLFLGNHFSVVGSPVFAIIIGMILSIVIKNKAKFNEGLKFTSKKILQSAVVLLGFGLNINVIILSGKESLPIIISTILIALVLAFFLQKILKIEKNIAILIGVGSAICGGSAIAATSPVIKAKESEIAQSIGVIFLFNVIAAIVFPAIGDLLSMTDYGFGVFSGTAINDTSSVTSAALTWDEIHKSNTLELATIVKLTRTLAIIPITIVLGIIHSKQGMGKLEKSSNVSIIKVFPTFIIFFLAFAILSTVVDLGSSFLWATKWMSKFFIAMAMAAIGVGTDIKVFVKSGIKPIVLGLTCWISIIIVSLIMQKIMGLF